MGFRIYGLQGLVGFRTDSVTAWSFVLSSSAIRVLCFVSPIILHTWRVFEGA